MQSVRCNVPHKPRQKTRPMVAHQMSGFSMADSYFYEKDCDDLEGQQIRIKPQPIDKLCRLTKFAKHELQTMYRGFKQDCPSGVVKEEIFKLIYAQFFPRGSDSNQYAHLIFSAFDPEKTGAITFSDLVIGLSILSRGTIEDKIRWIFRLYDTDCDGILSREDLFKSYSAIYDLMGRSVSTPLDEREKSDQFFERIDTNGSGLITVNDFIEFCLKDERICSSLNVFDTVV